MTALFLGLACLGATVAILVLIVKAVVHALPANNAPQQGTVRVTVSGQELTVAGYRRMRTASWRVGTTWSARVKSCRAEYSPGTAMHSSPAAFAAATP